MQIIIPMSGFGERFRRAGFTSPKPLIEVDGKPIIGHVIDMFPGETDFIFICNEDHLINPDYQMTQTLQKLCPTGRIVGIPAHKLGPIHAVRQVEHLLDPARPVVVNYCDFTCYWDWFHFKLFVTNSACAGAIPAYKGFHPHTLGTTNYAYIKEFNGGQPNHVITWAQDIQEKQPYTDNRMEEFASSGTYYFANAKLMSDAFEQTICQNIHVGGEYYVSLAYKNILAKGDKVAIYPLQHFMQWGTPEDLREYNFWSDTFKKLTNPNIKTYRYKISYVDTCGIETPLSGNHTTMLLSSNVGINGTVNLSWNPYEGFTYPNFEIWRSTDGVNFIKIGAVANNSYAYIDNNPPSIAWYQIRITKQDACLATKRGENYVGSNIISKEGKSLYINEQKNESITIYPNPTKDIITIQNAHGNTLRIVDVQGKEVYNALVTNVKTEISMKTFGKAGVYILHIVDANNVSIETKQIVLE